MSDLQILLLATASVVLVYALAFLHKVRPIFIYCIPTINVLAALFADYQLAGSLHSGHLRVLLLFGFVVLMLPLFRLNAVTVLILLFVAYLLLLVPLASDPWHSLQGVLRPGVALLMLPVGYAFFTRRDQLNRLHLSIMAAVGILLLNFGLAQIFRFGPSVYVEDNVYLGEGSISMAYIFAYFLLMMPLMYRLLPSEKRFQRAALGFLLFFALIAMVLIFRRGALLGFACGLAAFTVLSPGKRSVRLFKLGAIAALLFLFSSSLYLEKLQRVAEQRADIVGFVSNTERGRMAEFGLVTTEMMGGSLRHALIGSEPFNSRLYFNSGRSLHVDYMNLLNGTGLIGLSMYLLIHVAIALTLFRRARSAALSISREMRDTGLAIMAASLTISFSSQIYMITSLSFVFLYLGALLGVLADATGRQSHLQPQGLMPVAVPSESWSARSVRWNPARSAR